MNTFTKLVVNGVERYAAAFYDGSGNDIATTYETIAKVSEKEQALAERITTVNEALVALTTRVGATEAFDARITKNAEDINTNKEAIVALQGTDSEYREELNTLTIKIGTNTDNITTLDDDLNTLSKTVTRLSNDVGDLEAIITDEATGIDALNETKADKNSVNLSIENLSTRLSSLESIKDDYKSADETVLSTSQEYTNTEIGKLTEVYDSKGSAASFNEAMDTRVKVLEEIDHSTLQSTVQTLVETVNNLTARIVALENASSTEEPTPEDTTE